MNLVDKLVDEIYKNPKKISIIGDAMIDRWVHGHLEPCQDKCSKFVQEEVITTPGGADNAVNCLQNWDVEVNLTCAVNRCVKTRFMVDNEIVFRHDHDVITNSGGKYRVEEALPSVGQSHAVLLSDYDKGFLTPEIIEVMSAACRERGIPCVADCKRPPKTYAGCILKGNKDYWSRYSAPIETQIVMTRGADVPWFFGGDLPTDAQSVKCINHVGAGDCFAAHLTLALAYGFSLKEAAAIAHSAGRVYVQHPHNRPPTPGEIAADLRLVSSVSVA